MERGGIKHFPENIFDVHKVKLYRSWRGVCGDKRYTDSLPSRKFALFAISSHFTSRPYISIFPHPILYRGPNTVSEFFLLLCLFNYIVSLLVLYFENTLPPLICLSYSKTQLSSPAPHWMLPCDSTQHWVS